MTNLLRRPRSLALWLAALLLALPVAATDAFAPAGTGGLEAVDHALRALQQHRRLLIVGAHPDDEDTVLLTLLSRGWGAEAAYLSLTRGDGGQNLVGEELGEALGVLRTEELLAAREIDGASQYFTRAYDFGYTRSLEETFDLWPREILLRDVVRVVRAFRPQVVVSVFSPTSRAGHGQHQAAGVLALDAFHAAGDPSVFPEQRDEGLEPWSPSLLYRSAWWDPEAATLEIPAADLDPFRGRSFVQIAMESRSQHASQSMGRSQDPGPRFVRLVRLEGPAGAPADELFGGVATDLEALADLVPPGPPRDELRSVLQEIRVRSRVARTRATVEDPAAAAEPLAASLLELRDLRRRLRDGGDSDRAARHFDAFLAEKERIAIDGLAAAAGIVFDAWTERSEAVPGDSIAVELTLWNAGPFEVRLPGTPLTVTSPGGWLAAPRSFSLEAAGEEGDEEAVPGPALEVLPPGTLGTNRRELGIERDAPPTVPYFLRSPRSGALYALQPGDRTWWGLPFAPEPLQASVSLALGVGERPVPLTLDRPVVARRVDLASGELREPVRLVPRIEVSVTPEVSLWPLPGEETRSIAVRLRLHGDEPREGTVTVGAPRGWPVPEPVPFELTPASSETRLSLEIRLPASMSEPRGRFELPVLVTTDAGEELGRAVPLVSHPHVRPRPVPTPAETRLSVFPLALPPLDAVGYVPGAADEVPEALAAVGVPVEVLDPAALAGEDLSRFDAVVIGSRAYEISPALGAVTEQLDAYVRGGGLILVQFQRWEYFNDGLPPVSLAMENRGQRTTDETSPVVLLEPGHPVFHQPNRIDDEDWGGWVQERGVYYPTSWGPEVVPLLSLSDPDDPDQRGSLLVARVGEGTYVYTGLAFFRQLPAGVPGAFRLFSNLLALSSEDPP